MSVINIYLNETPLTSTKNVFLEQDPFVKIYEGNNQFKRKLINVLSSSPKCLTSNTFLLHENFSKQKDDVPEKKKKKKKKAECKKLTPKNIPRIMYRSMPRSKFRNEVYTSSDTIANPCASSVEQFDQYSDEMDSLNVPPSNNRIEENLENLTYGPASINQNFTFGSANINQSIAFRSSNINRSMAFECTNFNKNLEGKLPAVFGGVAFGSAGVNKRFQDLENEPEKIISKMPVYNLEAIKLCEDTEIEFSTCSIDSKYCESFFTNAKRKKMQLLNVVSMALMFTSNLKDEGDNYRITLQKSMDDVMLIEPEFILKIALYARQELQIRTVSNFLLSYSAIHQNARMYLEKYFEASIVLPSDWIQVAEYFQILNCGQHKVPFPAALRRVMRKTFQKFDKYQLAKYNRNKTKKKQKAGNVSIDAMDITDEEITDDDSNRNLKTINKTFTLKKLIRSLHIDLPAEHVMCLLEKKYPKNHQEFISSGLPGVWDPEKSGKRMKLPTPETWETRISACGNEPHVWESLIDNGKLPYMAMLRNLKNLILSGISSSHHKKIIANLQNKKYVMNSRQLPMQYFEAYKVLLTLQKMVIDEDILSDKIDSLLTPVWKKKQLKKTKNKIQNASESLVEEYKEAISKALEISSLNNLHPIPGKTLIICQIDSEEVNALAKFESYIMICLMSLKACEDCSLCIFRSSKQMEVISLKEDDQFLDVLIKTCKKLRPDIYDNDPEIFNPVSELKKLLDSYLKSQSMFSMKLDHLIFLQTSDCMEAVVSSFLCKYRQLVNSDLLYTNVNFNLRNNCFSGECISDKDAYVCGSSSSLVKFIAERSSGSQLSYVENIDAKYNLPEISESKFNRSVSSPSGSKSTDVANRQVPVPLNYKMPKWRTFRIFISSTFKDMISERDLLIRYVFPELKRRAASIFARIVEIDLRWGITETDSSTKRAAEICLREAQKADIFVGIIGERYGSIYKFETPDSEDLKWIKDCLPGKSITELEMHAAAFRNPQESRGKSFFYFRDNSFIRNVPKKWAEYFMSEDFESKIKIDLLKQKIKSENFKVFDGYPCEWAGTCENKPVLSRLDILGNRILNDLWTAVQEIQKTEPSRDSLSEAEVYQETLIESKKFCVVQKNFSSESVASKIVSKQGIFVIHGTAGCGKTTFLINLLPCLKSLIVLKFFIGISPRSRDLSYIIQYLCKSICNELGTSVPLPSLPADLVSYFPDFLLEISNCCGGREILFLIDGLDHLEENDQRLDWLPLFVPKRIKVLCSASESSVAFKVLCERESLGSTISFFEIPPFVMAEREQLVRNYLSHYRKVLDENAFSNKMLKIVTKKDSSNPFYLQIVCDFLRIYGSFENLDLILQKLPSSTTLFFQEIILQMENEFGCVLVQTVLTLLCITKEGLEDADLHYVLSFAGCINDLKKLPSFTDLKEKISSLEPENLLCQVKYCSLISTISTFAYGYLRQESFSLVGTEFEKAVQKFYCNKNMTSYSKSLHCILAAYFHNICDMTNDESYKVSSGFTLRSLMYHMSHGGLYKELSDLLCNTTYLKAVFNAHADGDLLEYYSLLLHDVLPSNQKLIREIDYSRLSSFYGFVSRNFHIFHQYPELLIQQAVNEVSSLIDLKRNKPKCCLLENLSRSSTVDHRLATLNGFTKNITASVGEKLNNFVILGTEDGFIKVLDLTTRKVDRTIKAHASEITCICSIEKDKICVSSIDGTLTLWNTQDFKRISVLSGHRHRVTCCCSDPTGYILYSTGWDKTIRLWSVKDGRSIRVIEDFRCPVNWIDHHPQKQVIVCGLWNGSIETWDTVSIQRIKVFPSVNSSVQTLAYTPDGINIVSSYINSEIVIWSSEEGLKMSCLTGHILPVKTITSLLSANLLVSGSDDCTLKVWSTFHRSHFTSIADTKFCPINLIELISEDSLVVSFQNAEIWVYDISNGNVISKIALESDVVSVFSKYSSISINSQDFTNIWKEKRLVFGTQSGKLMVGNVLDCSVTTVMEFHSKITAAVHNAEVILCGISEGDIGLFYPSEQLSKIIYSAHEGFIGTLSLAKQDETLYLLSSANDNVLKLWSIELDDFELIIQKEFLSKHRDSITFSRFRSPLPTSSLSNFFTGSYDNDIILWDNNSVVQVFQGLQSSVLIIACCKDYILGCGNDGALVMWNQNGTVLTSIPGINQSSAILTFYVTEEESDEFAVTLAYVDLDGSIKINKPLQLSYYCSFDGHSKPITSCCATENKEVLSCSLDGSINIWKVPLDASNGQFKHETYVTGLILSTAFDFAVSSDAYGNLILWKVDLESLSSPLAHAGKKKYDQGFIKKLSWLKSNKFACAASQITESGETNFLEIIQFNNSPNKTALCLQVMNRYTFENEIVCFDSSEENDDIVVGLKSGEVVYITHENIRIFKVCNDWILGLCFISKGKPSNCFCVSSSDGLIKYFTATNFLSFEDDLPELLKAIEPSNSKEKSNFTSVMCSAGDKFICCGDSDGSLRIYAHRELKFFEKVHDDLVSGMCIIDTYLFTSSLDKTVKGWNLKSFKQVCQFHSHTPISCLSLMQRDSKENGEYSNILLIGTSSGNVQLLQFHSY